MTRIVLLAATAGWLSPGCAPDNDKGVPPTTQPSQIVGMWTATVTHAVTTTCGGTGQVEVFTLTIEEDEGLILISSDSGYSAEASLGSAGDLSFTYSFPDSGGTTTSTVTLEFASLLGGELPILDSFTGSAHFEWVSGDSTVTCDGTDNWDGVRFTGGPPAGNGLTGSWNLSLTLLSTTCSEIPQQDVTIPVVVLQVVDQVTVTLPGLGDFTGTLDSATNQLTLQGQYLDADYEVTAEGVLDVSADENTVSGTMMYTYVDLADPTGDCTGEVDWLMERL